jgi:hypothetical protein
MPEKGRWDSVIGTNRSWPELLASKKNPEIKVPRGCRGYVCLKYSVWESSLVMEQRSVFRFWTVKELSTRDITAELKGV